jgi:hypothetical protein
MSNDNTPDDNTPNDNIDDAADTAHDKIDDLAPEGTKYQAHDAVEQGQDAAKHAADSAQRITDAAATKAGPLLDRAKSIYSKNPRAFQIGGGLLLAFTVFRRIRAARK